MKITLTVTTREEYSTKRNLYDLLLMVIEDSDTVTSGNVEYTGHNRQQYEAKYRLLVEAGE